MLESRDVPAQFRVTLLSPAEGASQSTQATITSTLATNNLVVEASSVEQAAEQALLGTVLVNAGGNQGTYDPGSGPGSGGVGSNPSQHLAFLLTPEGDTYRIGLEDLSFIPGVPVDWDYNDVIWYIDIQPIIVDMPMPVPGGWWGGIDWPGLPPDPILNPGPGPVVPVPPPPGWVPSPYLPAPVTPPPPTAPIPGSPPGMPPLPILPPIIGPNPTPIPPVPPPGSPPPPPGSPPTVGSISGLAWNDDSRLTGGVVYQPDGIRQPTEAKRSGVVVYLYGVGGSAYSSMTVTNEYGLYEFTNLPLGNYVLGFQPVGPYGDWSFTKFLQGSDRSLDSDVVQTSALTGFTPAITLTSLAAHKTNIDAGIIQLYSTMPVPPGPLGSISGTVWDDSTDGDGIMESGEPRLANRRVLLWSEYDKRYIKETTTNAQGNYSFSVLRNENYYKVAFPSAAAYSFTDYRYGSPATDNDVLTMPLGQTVGFTDYLFVSSTQTVVGAVGIGVASDSPRTEIVNITSDTNVDGRFNSVDDNLENDSLGKIVFTNNDDDNADLEMDVDTPGQVIGEDDLAEVRLNIPSNRSGQTARLRVLGDAAAIRLWKNSDRTGPLGTLQEYIVGQNQIPSKVYVEGISTGVAYLQLEVGNNAVSEGPNLDLLKFTVSKFELDVNNNMSTGDIEDGFHNYMPGYIASTPQLSTGKFAAVTAISPQPLHAIFNGLGTGDGVGKVYASLSSVSSEKGYTGNVADELDGIFSTKDISFHPSKQKDKTDTNDDGGVDADKAWIDFFVRDYGAIGNLNAWVYDTNKRVRGTSSKQVVRDVDNDYLQDGWEESSVKEFTDQAGFAFTVPDLAVFSGYTNPTDELQDVDQNNTDGGRDLGKHKTQGDSLTAWQEYRGFILDGGGYDGAGNNGHAGGHKRLSPAFKELLIEVDAMPKANVAKMPTAAELKTVMETASKGFSNQTNGAGIRLYWVVDEPVSTYALITSTSDATTYAQAHRNSTHLSEFVHLILSSEFQHKQDLTGITYNKQGYSGGCFVFPDAISTMNPVASFLEHIASTASHELTHAIIEAKGKPGFASDEEHETNPDPADGELGPLDLKYLMIKGELRTPRNMILFSDNVLSYIDLNRKESVEI
jgi:SdrD B-like domain